MTHKLAKLPTTGDPFANTLDGPGLYRVTEEDEGIMTEESSVGKSYTVNSHTQQQYQDGDMDDPDVMHEYKAAQDQSFFERSQRAKRIRLEQLADWRRREGPGGEGDGKIEGGLAQSGSMRHRRAKRKKKTVMFEWNVLFMDAVMRNELVEVERLLSTYESLEKSPMAELVNCRTPDGLSPLHQCCIENLAEMANLLIRSGAELRATDPELWTPLHAGATCGHYPVVRVLLDAGKAQNLVLGEQVDLVRDMLLAVNSDGNMPFDLCEEDQTLAYIEQEMQLRGITQDDIEAKRHKKEVDMLRDLQQFIESNFTRQVHSSSSSSVSVRQRALKNSQQREIWNRFIAASKLPNAVMMHIAAANGYHEVLDLLLKYKYPVDLEDDDGWQPIHAAVAWNETAAARKLVEAGADISAKVRGNGQTALDLAVMIGDSAETRETFRDELISLDALYKVRCEEERKGHLVRKPSTESVNSHSNSTSPLLRRASPKSQRVQRKSSLKDKEDLIALLHAIGDHDLKSPENNQMTIQKFTRSPGGSLRDRAPVLPNVPEEVFVASNVVEISDVDLINETISSELISNLLRSFEEVEDDDNDSVTEQLQRTAGDSLNQIDQPVTLSQLKSKRNRFRMLKKEKPFSARELPKEPVREIHESSPEKTTSCIPLPVITKPDTVPLRSPVHQHSFSSNGGTVDQEIRNKFTATEDEMPVGPDGPNNNKLNEKFGRGKKKEKTSYIFTKSPKVPASPSDEHGAKTRLPLAHGCCSIM